MWPGDGVEAVGGLLPVRGCRQLPSCTVLWPRLCRPAIVACPGLLHEEGYRTAHPVPLPVSGCPGERRRTAHTPPFPCSLDKTPRYALSYLANFLSSPGYAAL